MWGLGILEGEDGGYGFKYFGRSEGGGCGFTLGAGDGVLFEIAFVDGAGEPDFTCGFVADEEEERLIKG